jgi:hypothetical protein
MDYFVRKIFKLFSSSFFKMNNQGLGKTFFIVVLILIIAGGVSYFAFFRGESGGLDTQDSSENNENFQEESNVGVKSSEQCSLMSESTIDEAFEKWDCFTTLAEAEGDYSVCDLIPLVSEGGSYANKYTCYRIVAIKIKNLSLCEKIPSKLSWRCSRKFGFFCL